MPPSFLGITQRKNNKTKPQPPSHNDRGWSFCLTNLIIIYKRKKHTYMIETFNAHILLQIVFHNGQKKSYNI